MSDGRWAAAVSVGYKTNADGQVVRARKVLTATNRYDVAEKLKKLLRDQQQGINIAPERWTVSAFLDDWLKSLESDVSPITYGSYADAIRLHIVPVLGKIELARLTAPHVEGLKRTLLEKVVTRGPGIKKPVKSEPPAAPRYLSGASVKYCLLVLRMALDRGVKLDLIPRNVALLVDFPKVVHTEIQPYSPEEAQRFLEAAKSHRLGPLFTAAMALGLRKGETLGLQWPAVDLERGTLAVRASLQRVRLPGAKKSELILKDPKRRGSRRTLNLPQAVLSELLRHRERQEQERLFAGSRWQDTGYVFTTQIGTPLEPRNLSRAFDAIVRLAKLPRVRIHDLRHTAATLLLAQGVHPRVVMELLGHSQIAVTMNTYSHVIPALQKEAADRMDAALTPSPVANAVANGASSGRPN
jgi:integrase